MGVNIIEFMRNIKRMEKNFNKIYVLRLRRLADFDVESIIFNHSNSLKIRNHSLENTFYNDFSLIYFSFSLTAPIFLQGLVIITNVIQLKYK